jgi:hypothetical protein
MTYAVKYLAGAYHAAGGNQDRAVGFYARGYYYEAKRQRLVQAGTGADAQLFQRRSAARAVRNPFAFLSGRKR